MERNGWKVGEREEKQVELLVTGALTLIDPTATSHYKHQSIMFSTTILVPFLRWLMVSCQHNCTRSKLKLTNVEI